MSQSHVIFDFCKHESCEEEEESGSYPGVSTVYRKTIVEGVVSCADSQFLSCIGLTQQPAHVNQASGSSGLCYHFEDSSGIVRFFSWLTEKECIQRRVKLWEPK